MGHVRAPTLLIVGTDETPVIALNLRALYRVHGLRELAIVEGASHLVDEPGTLAEASGLARGWFLRYLAPQPVSAAKPARRGKIE